jgi:hypothetical protein
VTVSSYRDSFFSAHTREARSVLPEYKKGLQKLRLSVSYKPSLRMFEILFVIDMVLFVNTK